MRRLNEFWIQWRDEYLLSLRERQDKIYRDRVDKSPAVNDLVLVHDENQPRGSWNLARIIELIPSSDGLIREVKVKTATGTLNRAPRHLYLLETSGEKDINLIPDASQRPSAIQKSAPESARKHSMTLRPRKLNTPGLHARTQPTVIDVIEMQSMRRSSMPPARTTGSTARRARASATTRAAWRKSSRR